ncbi:MULTISPECIES: GNAT family N-acetyltransferase [Phyllobacterium]|jgi:RimJ/RimL family protein N-acetyltransferase|uniref:GNAT family N-acetyltransferase n=1 Tax=Phyllobacterium sophorae TaxID=1520277 RepID=A0A2P7BLQ2_9HYPH|nr:MULTISPECIES: GNAT family N-acetyltransferase [Phyllobacterium]PSH67364.1 GNAT family N-acetyltransferase [Phyllobacterium sophorae]UXN65590.1 GNAT family N-acetyltransferase [Phyllobacterium sp. A18/5-2]
MIPTLETDRLILRPHRREDFEAVHAMWQHPAIYTQITGKPSTREQSWARLLRYAGLWPLIGYGFWAMEDKATGRFVGELGFADFQREINPPFGDAPEMGWVLAPEIHGKGYGSEALASVVEWGDTFFKQDRALCIISPENAASLRVAEKNGFSKVLETTYTDEPVILLERAFRPN